MEKVKLFFESNTYKYLSFGLLVYLTLSSLFSSNYNRQFKEVNDNIVNTKVDVSILVDSLHNSNLIRLDNMEESKEKDYNNLVFKFLYYEDLLDKKRTTLADVQKLLEQNSK